MSKDTIYRQDFDKFLEDAEKEAVKNRKYVFASALNTIRGNLKIFPSAQPEIILCKDCIYSHTDIYYGEECLTCENTDGLCCDVYKEDYCSMGERRTDV